MNMVRELCLVASANDSIWPALFIGLADTELISGRATAGAPREANAEGKALFKQRAWGWPGMPLVRSGWLQRWEALCMGLLPNVPHHPPLSTLAREPHCAKLCSRY